MTHATIQLFISNAVVQVSLSVENGGLVGEDNGVAVVTVTLTGDLKTDVTLNIATVAGTGVLFLCISLNVHVITCCHLQL